MLVCIFSLVWCASKFRKTREKMMFLSWWFLGETRKYISALRSVHRNTSILITAGFCVHTFAPVVHVQTEFWALKANFLENTFRGEDFHLLWL